MKKHLLFILLAFIIVSCGKKDKINIENVVIVNDREITVDEFSFAYELTPRRITQLGKEEAFPFVLENIINTILLAQEATRLGLNNDSIVQKAIDYHKRSSIVGELYLKHIRDSVMVSDEELKKSYLRSKTTNYVKHFVASSEDEAEYICNGLLETQHIPLLAGVKTVELNGFGYVDVISWNDVLQEFEDIIYKLPLNQRSKPYFDGKYSHIFEVVYREQEVLLTENDYHTYKPTLESATRKRKEHKAAFQYVQKIMKPQDVVIKAYPLNRLTDIIWNDYNGGEILNSYIDNKDIQSITLSSEYLLNQNIVVFKGGRITVEDFLFTYKLNPKQISFKSKESVRENLKNIIATYARDYVLSEEGIKEGLDKKTSVKNEVRIWEERFLADRLKKDIYEQIKNSVSDSTDILKEYNSAIESLTQDLRESSDIEIDKDKLFSVKTSDEGLRRKIDFVATYVQ
jgi:hypothetical protein